MTDTAIVALQIGLTALTAVLTLVPTFYKMKAQRQREEAGSAHELSEAALGMVRQWQETNAELRATKDEMDKRLRRVEREVRYWQKGATMLIQQCLKEGLVPCFDPNGGPSFDDDDLAGPSDSGPITAKKSTSRRP